MNPVVAMSRAHEVLQYVGLGEQGIEILVVFRLE